MSPPRERTPKNRDLPDNLYPNGKYWQYRNPVTGRKVSINQPKAAAIKLAIAANAKLAPMMVDDGALLALLTGEPARTFKHLLDRFEVEWLPGRQYAAGTLNEIRIKLARYREDLGSRMVGQLDVLEVAGYLDQFKNNAYTKHRGLLVQVFAFAVAKGLAERNVAELTLVKKEGEKVRQRHTEDGIKTILEFAGTPDWLARAIRLGLVSLQRREDIVTWAKSAVDLERNTLTVSPGKTENYKTPINLEIEMGAALREAVVACMKSPIVCPYLLSCIPKRRIRKQMDAKLHWNAVTPDYLTKEFAKARDESGAYKDLPPLARPTFHELRAYGSWLYEQQGFEKAYVQALMGHADEEMTTHYQAGHEPERIEFERVKAELKLPF